MNTHFRYSPNNAVCAQLYMYIGTDVGWFRQMLTYVRNLKHISTRVVTLESDGCVHTYTW